MKFTITFKDQDLFTLAAHADIGYWCRADSTDRIVIEAETGKKFKITKASLKKAMEIMPKEAPHAFAEIVTEGDGADSTIGDILVQLACFGKVVYG